MCQRKFWQVSLINRMLGMSKGKGNIRDDGYGSGLSMWMDGEVISLNEEGSQREGSSEFLWDKVSLRPLRDAK